MPQQQMSEEQLKELQEKIKNMSPEELKEFQKKQCIFCHIISGKAQSKKIYEDNLCLAILDIAPSNPGHILLMPKEHYSIMAQLSEDEVSHIFMVAKAISNVILRALGVQGTNLIVQNGIAAGQKAQHFMVHIIPRKEKDGIEFKLPKKEISEKELEDIRIKLEAKLGTSKEKGPKSKRPEKKKAVPAEFTEKKSEENKKKSPPKKGKAAKKGPEKADLDEITRILGVK
ncbi:HIT family protein [Candidatus Woesearchaeota archaeon]|nr:HIT family protein [Candidatus Woesearchaeota archaeon]